MVALPSTRAGFGCAGGSRRQRLQVAACGVQDDGAPARARTEEPPKPPLLAELIAADMELPPRGPFME